MPEESEKKIEALTQELAKEKAKSEQLQKLVAGIVKFVSGAGLDIQNFGRSFEQELNKITNPLSSYFDQG